ncbi:hypothetical protein [Streptococcus plurextorum]|uniref:hypothetical protein n=1 Tax=Streptococcus plurextorum TaxID=456876 RepID=UPI00040AA6B8|nr:hypothetical protein [Streptococcus plurextorum]
MKNFDDFLTTLSHDEVVKILDSANKKLEETRTLDELAQAVYPISFYVSLGLLAKYHEWLNQ